MPTIVANTRDRQVLAPSRTEMKQVRQVVEELETSPAPRLELQSDRHRDVVAVPIELSAVLVQILQIVNAGGSITIASMPEELTTSTAAEQLGVSRPTLMKMVQRGEIAAHRVGTHTRLKTTDVMDFRRAREARRRQAFDDLRAVEDDED